MALSDSALALAPGTSLPLLAVSANRSGATTVKIPLGDLHRGAERRLEESTWAQAAVTVARLDALGSGAREVAFALAVEALCDAAVAPRAVVLRRVYLLLEQLVATTGFFAALTDLRGGSALAATCRTARELTLDVLEAWTGARIHHDLCVFGGLRADVDQAWVLQAHDLLDALWRWARRVDDQLLRSRAWQGDTRGLAVIEHRDALALGITGAALRASSGEGDDPPRHPSGDVFARVWVRLQDVRWHCRQLRRTLATLPAGPVGAPPPGVARFPERVTAGEVAVNVEHGGGTLGLFVVSDGGARPWRVRVASPSVPAAAAAVGLIAEAPAESAELILLSLWPVWGEAAR